MASRRRPRGDSGQGDAELWVGFARDAITAISRNPIAKEDDPKVFVNDTVAIATSYADEMLDEYLERFTKRRWDWAEPRDGEDEDDEEDEDEDDEDDED